MSDVTVTPAQEFIAVEVVPTESGINVVVVETPAPAVEVITNSQNSVPQAYQTALGVLATSPTVHKEFTYTADDCVSQIDTWDSPAKALKLFTKVFGYDANGDVVLVTTVNEPAGITHQASLGYDASGSLVSVTEVFV